MFDLLQNEGKHFVCRIKSKTIRTLLEQYPVAPDSYVFEDSLTLLGIPGVNQTQKPFRAVGYKIAGIKYYVATDRFDLTAQPKYFLNGGKNI